MDFTNYLIIALLLAIVFVSWFKSAILSQGDIGRDANDRERKLAGKADDLQRIIGENYAYANVLRGAAERIETANAIAIAAVASSMPKEPITDEEFQELIKREAAATSDAEAK